MSERLTTRNDPLSRELVARSLSVRAETVNEEQRSVEATLSTPNAVPVFDFGRFEVIDEILIPRGAEFADQVPLLESHNRFSTDDVLGSIRNIRVEGDKVVGRLFFAEGDERADRVWNKVRQGHITDVSIGYRADKFVDIPANQSQTIDGRSYTAKDRTLRITSQFTIREGSTVPIGADQAAKIRAEAGLPFQRTEIETMNKNLRKYLESIGLRADATDEQAQAFFEGLGGDQRTRAEAVEAGTMTVEAAIEAGVVRAEPTATPPANPPADPPADVAAATRAGVEAERQRQEAIRELAGNDIGDDLVQRAISEGWDEDRASREFLRRLREGRPAPVGAPAIHSRSHERDCTARSLAAGLMHRTSCDVIDAEFLGRNSNLEGTLRMTEQDADMGDRYRSWSMVDFCREALRIDGTPIPENRFEMIRAATSSATLTNIFSTSVHARLLMGYSEAVDTSDWCSSEDVSNFQTQERASMGKTAALEKLERGGTAEHATISDSVETYKIARYAKQFVVDEQDIVDDNLNGIQTMPGEMGAAAARLRPDLVYAILLANDSLGADSTALFHADHNNTDTNALSSANLQNGITTMMQQTQDSVRLNLRPVYLITPGDLEWTSRELLTSGQLLITGNTDDVRGNRNVLRDLNLQLRVEGRIDANGVTDPATGTAQTGSATTWFLASSPGRTVVVGYLAGTRRRPQMRRFTLDRGQYGLGWDIKMDIGAKALDFRGLYRGNT